MYFESIWEEGSMSREVLILLSRVLILFHWTNLLCIAVLFPPWSFVALRHFACAINVF